MRLLIMISVVIPLYNKASTIRRCLKSVFSQTIAPNELIIINDGSQDDSLEIVKQVIDFNSEISIKIVDQKNAGVSYTRNKGVSLARNKYIAFLDADDEWHEEFIESAQKVISKHQDISLFTCKHKIFDNSIGSYIPKQDFGRNETGIIDNYLSLAKSYPIVNSSKVVVNKLYFSKVGGFPEKAKVCEDLFLWIKLSECAPIAYCDKLLVTIYQAPDNSRGARVGEIPYPIMYYSSKHIDQKLQNDLYLLLWSIHFKHVLGSCTTNKKEAFNRILYGIKLFKFKGAVLLPLLIIPKFIFNYIRIKRRTKMVKASA
jgi:glycosyltransferase involved in cell wall biosynthesis